MKNITLIKIGNSPLQNYLHTGLVLVGSHVQLGYATDGVVVRGVVVGGVVVGGVVVDGVVVRGVVVGGVVVGGVGVGGVVVDGFGVGGVVVGVTDAEVVASGTIPFIELTIVLMRIKGSLWQRALKSSVSMDHTIAPAKFMETAY